MIKKVEAKYNPVFWVTLPEKPHFWYSYSFTFMVYKKKKKNHVHVEKVTKAPAFHQFCSKVLTKNRYQVSLKHETQCPSNSTTLKTYPLFNRHHIWGHFAEKSSPLCRSQRSHHFTHSKIATIRVRIREGKERPTFDRIRRDVPALLPSNATGPKRFREAKNKPSEHEHTLCSHSIPCECHHKIPVSAHSTKGQCLLHLSFSLEPSLRVDCTFSFTSRNA